VTDAVGTSAAVLWFCVIASLSVIARAVIA
jgi:hypothetical protein